VSQSSQTEIDQNVAEEAAQWLLRFQEGNLDKGAEAAFETWLNRSAMHIEAWQRAERLLLVGSAPSGLPGEAIRRLRILSRRQAIKALALVVVGGPVAWQMAHELPAWSADLRTKYRRHSLTLPDDSRLVLNAHSAVDVQFSPTERRLRLHAGEILVTTHPDVHVPARPFLVQTDQGFVRALGTRFSVRQLDNETWVAVFQEAVEIKTGLDNSHQLPAGRQAAFKIDDVLPDSAVSPYAAAWENGLFVANRLRLEDLAAELARYRSGFVRCHPDVADLAISGTFSIDDTDRALDLLEKSLPVSINRRMPYLVLINPR
jgi:transmembrane sensor